MRRFEFRLEPVLKLRKLKEENCRMELGQLLTEMTRIEDQLTHDRYEIGKYFEVQEAALKTGMSGGQLQAFPMLVSAKESNIRLLERDKIKLAALVETKKNELAQLRGDLKVMENLKQKNFDEWRKATNKEIDQKVEEQTQIWLNHKDK